MIKKLIILLTVFVFSCEKKNLEDDLPEINPKGEVEFKFSNHYSYPKLEVNSLNEYIVTGTSQINFGEIWSEFILNVNNTLTKQYFGFCKELKFIDNEVGGELSSKIVENNNVLVYGTLNNRKCVIAKYTSKGNLIWFHELVGEYSDLIIRNLVRFNDDYFFIGHRIDYCCNGGNGEPAFLTEIGKITMDGNIVFSKVLGNYSIGLEIEVFNNNSLLVSSTRYWNKQLQQQVFDYSNYDTVFPLILNIDFDGNIIWESVVNELETNLFHPTLYFMRKGNEGIYCSYNRRTFSVDAKITKLNFSGNVLWTKPIKGLLNFPRSKFFINIHDIALDNDDNVYFVGYTDSNSSSSPSVFGLAKFDSNGNYLKSFTNNSSNNRLAGYGVKVDKENNIITASMNNEKDNITLLKLSKDLKVL